MKIEVNARAIRWKIFGLLMSLMLIMASVIDFLGGDYVLVTYVWGIVVCLIGFVLFMWLRQVGRASPLLTCIMFLFAAGLWIFTLAVISRHAFVIGDWVKLEHFFRTFWWKTRAIPMIGVFTFIVVYLYVRLKYGKDKDEF